MGLFSKDIETLDDLFVHQLEDIYYAENWSPGMDLRILLQTIPVVLSGKGAY